MMTRRPPPVLVDDDCDPDATTPRTDFWMYRDQSDYVPSDVALVRDEARACNDVLRAHLMRADALAYQALSTEQRIDFRPPWSARLPDAARAAVAPGAAPPCANPPARRPP